MKKKILCVAVHPDDESLGAGGSLLKWKSEGHEIHWLIMTKIDESLGYGADKISQRNEEIKKVSSVFEFTTTTVLKFQTTKLDTYPLSDIVGEISNVISKIKPDTLIIPHRFDAHSDHRISYEALIPFFKSFRYPYITTVLAMETLSETGYALGDSRETFAPNYFVDISNFLKNKIDMMKLYKGELGNHPFPRSEASLTAQAQLRGAYIATDFAEAFQLIKMIYE